MLLEREQFLGHVAHSTRRWYRLFWCGSSVEPHLPNGPLVLADMCIELSSTHDPDNHNDHNHHFHNNQGSDKFAMLNFTLLVGLPMAEGASTGADMRRRHRRLRQFLRHELPSVAVSLAEKLHHSACRTDFLRKVVVKHEQHNAHRSQKTATGREPQLFDVLEEELLGR